MFTNFRVTNGLVSVKLLSTIALFKRSSTAKFDRIHGICKDSAGMAGKNKVVTIMHYVYFIDHRTIGEVKYSLI